MSRTYGANRNPCTDRRPVADNWRSTEREIKMQDTMTEPPTPAPKTHRAGRMLRTIEPLTDPRWARFVDTHPRGSVFHSCAWLDALQRTYGYEPVAYTTAAPGEDLQNGAVFCRVESKLTGRRLVSLPFSDHCELLVDEPEDVQALAQGLERELRENKWQYFEIRPLREIEIASSLLQSSAIYRFHQIDLRPDMETLLKNCHPSSTQRKIQRALREKLTYKEGSGQWFLDSFYDLVIITRRRHQLPPQPKSWFRNLMNCFGNALKIRLTLKDGRPVAGMLTLRHKDTLIYKYGGSDSRFHNLGAMHLLYWESIRDAKNSGMQMFDLGRTDADQAGLIKFKNRWGARESKLTYRRYAETGDFSHTFDQHGAGWKMWLLKQAFANAPRVALPMLGNVLYKHAG